MTSPVVHGYPDYSRQTPESDVVFQSLTNVAVNAPTTYGPFFCGAFPAIGFRTSITGDNARVTITYYNDQAKTVQLGSLGYDVYTTGGGCHTFPVLGPWFTVQVTPGPANITLTMVTWAAPHPAMETIDQGTTSVLISNPAIAVGAGATATVDASWVVPGDASWVASSSLATFNASLYVVDYLGTETNLDVTTQYTNSYRRAIHLPYMRVRVRVSNQTGAAGTIGVRVSAHPVNAY